MRAPSVIGLALGLSLAAGPAGAEARELRFEREGRLLRSLPLSVMREHCEPRRVEVALDPYYGRAKRFLACPLGAVLALGFGASPDGDPEADYFFRALDGYVKPASAARSTT